MYKLITQSTALLSIALLGRVPLSVSAPPCQDDPIYTFGRFTWINQNNEEVETIRDCEWLTQNPNAIQLRKSVWCGATWNLGVAIKDKCPETCGECDLGETGTIDPQDSSPSFSTYCWNTPQWYDAAGPEFSCKFYEEDDNCDTWGHGYANFGQTAKEACCACGGGNRQQCANVEGWYDSGGPSYSCAWYEINPHRCPTYGATYENFGMVAKDACCVCNGGTKLGQTRNLNGVDRSNMKKNLRKKNEVDPRRRDV